MNKLKFGYWMVAAMLATSCSGEATNDMDRSDNAVDGNNADDGLAAACAAQPVPGDPCSVSGDCPVTQCQCADGSSVSTRSCNNGVCEGRDACDDTCRRGGAENACVEEATNNNDSNGSNGVSNNAQTNGENSDNNPEPMCERDLSAFADYSFSYDVQCLEANCCQEAFRCSTHASCRAYDDCLYTCFEGGGIDNDCIQSCKDQNATDEFLMDAYGPFSNCAIDNRC